MKSNASHIPTAFVWKRLHSITGLWLVAFLIIHLLTNSQAALLIGHDGSGFIESANSIRKLPYLQAIEIALLGIPFAIHIYWGIQYLFTGESNTYKSDGTQPSLPEYPRNQAYTWQRITSWVLLVLIAAHVVHMRFMEYPLSGQRGIDKYYIVRVSKDIGLYPLSERLGVTLYDKEQIAQEVAKYPAHLESIPQDSPQALILSQQEKENSEWVEALETHPLDPNQLLAVTKDFGTAELLMVRDTFKMPIMLVLYTLLVISACFHAFNGLWTFCITWGVTLSPRSQNVMRKISTSLMILIGFLGLAAIWGTYWINLKQ